MNNYKELFFQSVEKVLEKMFFILPETIEGDEVLEIIDDFEGSMFYLLNVSYSGEIDGVCLFYIPENLGNELVCNILGLESSDDFDDNCYPGDSIKEFGNMVLGNFMSENLSEKDCTLNIPEVTEETFSQDRLKENIDDWSVLNLDEKYLFFKIDTN